MNDRMRELLTTITPATEGVLIALDRTDLWDAHKAAKAKREALNDLIAGSRHPFGSGISECLKTDLNTLLEGYKQAVIKVETEIAALAA